jgi:hypothetical protein
MTVKQSNRQGRPWQRKSDGRWSVRAYPPDGSKPKMVYGATEAEVLDRQHDIETSGQAAPAENRSPLVTGSPPRTKPVRITVDLDPVRYRQLHELATAAVDVKSVSLAAVVRAMIDVASLDNGIRAVVVDMARRGGS